MENMRATGTGNFDIEAIRMAADAFERDAKPGENDQPPMALSVEEQRSVSAILELVEEFAANRSAGSGNELEAMLVTAIAAKLPAGTHSQIVGEIFREVERRDRSGFAEFGAEQWDRVKKEAKEERERLDKAADMADDAQSSAQQQEQQRQERAEAWANSDHTYAGKKMSGEEWVKMIQWFQSPENKAAWEDAMMAETGQTREQVRATGTKMSRFYELMEKQSKGEKLTPQEQAEFNRLDRDPEVKRGIDTQERLQKNQLSVAPISATNGANLDGSLGERSEQRTATYADGVPVGIAPAPTRASVKSVSSALDAENAATDTPALSTSFNKVAVGAEPEQPVALEVKPAPQIAAATVDASLAMM